jgi:hypothetical protein
VVGAAEIECFQPGADDVVTELFHDPLADFGIPSSTYGRTLEEKVIFNCPRPAFGRASFPV